MRLFTAIDPSAEVYQNLVELLRRLRPTARLRWSKAENLHLTLKFIGEWPDERLSELQQALSAAAAPSRFDVKFVGLGFFPNARAPRVFWVGVEHSPELAELAGQIDRALEPLGIEREKRAFSPHLTLARIEARTPLDPLRREIEALPSADFGSFRPESFYLYQSRLNPGGSVYTRLAEFPLVG